MGAKGAPIIRRGKSTMYLFQGEKEETQMGEGV